MGLSGTLITLGLIASAVYGQNPEVLQSDGSGIIHQQDGQTYLANGAGQIFRRADGKTVLIGSDGQQLVTDGDDSDEEDILDGHNNGLNNVIINGGSVIGGGSSFYQTGGKNYMFVTAQENSYLNSNGHSLRVVNGGLQLEEGGKQYTFVPRPADVNQKETVDINGQPATVEYSGGNVIVELADGTLIAKLGERVFMGDRQGFNNREQLAAEAHRQVEAANAYARDLSENLRRTMEKLNQDLQQSLGNLRF